MSGRSVPMPSRSSALCTDICVLANVALLKAYCPEVPMTVRASCCAGVTPEAHENALNAMKALQVEIL